MDEKTDIAGETAAPPTHAAVDPAFSSGWDLESADGSLAMSDNLPACPSVSEAELDAIERYMSDILDQVLGSRATDKAPEAMY